MPANELTLAKNGVGVSIGLLIMFFSAETLHWSRYMHANPDVGNIQTTFGFTPFYAAIFILGATISYVFFMKGLASMNTVTANE